MINEASFKAQLVKDVRALGGYARRLEDKYALGLLDLVIKLPQHPFLIAEGKLIEGHAFAPTARQYEEGKAWIKAGVKVLLIGWHGKSMYISPWVSKADKRDCYTDYNTDYGLSLLKYFGDATNESNSHRQAW